MPKRPLALFVLCFGVVVLSGAIVLVTADTWLPEPGPPLLGVRDLFLIWVLVLLEGPVLAAVSARFTNGSSGFAGTLAGAAAVTLASGVTNVLFLLFFVAGVVGLPLAAEFGIFRTLLRILGQRTDHGGPLS
jgi:hypothetical protein